ncbi:hypothetical protein AL064_26055 [Pseudomonas syringae pv. syringae]|uniref:hypothetical protein n=1 Tax=Pseudomonas syringae TaxID=317 RepID=UPI00076031B5|nr:hypothetical protein [Pseudomonas syringae]KWS17192.1 hypothetical protein AL064_26055 [Pseudomonas syringae pv. syringae]
MDVFTFISELIKALAWPAVAVAALVLLKPELKALAPFLKKLKAGPVEAEFERDVNKLKEMVDKPAHPVPPLSADVTASKEFLFQLAALHPRSAIQESWVRVEAAARAALARSSANPAKSYITAARLAQELSGVGALSETQVTLYHELRRLRNDAAHAVGAEPTQDSVHSYIELATDLQSHLEKFHK